MIQIYRKSPIEYIVNVFVFNLVKSIFVLGLLEPVINNSLLEVFSTEV